MQGASQRNSDSTFQTEAPVDPQRPRTISGLRPRTEMVQAPQSEDSLGGLYLDDIILEIEGTAGEPAGALSVEFPYDTHFFAGLDGDLSRGGLFVATYHVLPLGTGVKVAFGLPQGRRIEAHGRVKWIRDHDGPTIRRGLAIAFVDADADALRAVAEFCSVRAPLLFDFD